MGVTRRELLRSGGALLGAVAVPAAATVRDTATAKVDLDDRAGWIHELTRVSLPVLKQMSLGVLRTAMPVELAPGGKSDRAIGSPLEAFGRLVSGIAPWLESDVVSVNASLAREFREMTARGLELGVDPKSPAYLRFGETAQTLVDSAFLSLGLLRAPKQLIDTLSSTAKQQLIDNLIKERRIKPGMNNWLLFSAMNEALLFKLGAEWKRDAVEIALTKHREWYKGDGMYGDGPHFHWDYYNSFVIQPFMLQIADTLGAELPAFTDLFAAEKLRATRYAAIQERLIAPDGTYPVIGRSIAYRCGAFHLLADAARRDMLPEHVSPNQVRCALSAVMQRTLGAPGTFDKNGWLTIGLAGHQNSLGESYISTGSLYLCAEVFLPLGMPESHPFWSGPKVKWTQQKVWGGENFPADHAMDK